MEKSQSDKGTAGKESEAGAEISALVNYIQPIHFTSFDISKGMLKFEINSITNRIRIYKTRILNTYAQRIVLIKIE